MDIICNKNVSIIYMSIWYKHPTHKWRVDESLGTSVNMTDYYDALIKI